MHFRVLLFAKVKEVLGTPCVEVVVAEVGCTVGALRHALVAQFPITEHMLPACLIAVNEEYVTDDTLLKETDEIAVIPPVSGG